MATKQNNKGKGKAADKVKSTSSNGLTGLEKIIAIVSKNGIAASVVGSLLILIFCYSETSQKQEIIDTWVLMKTDVGQNIKVLYFFALFLLLMMQQFHYTRVIQDKDARIKELANKKTARQVELIGANLSTSETL